VVSIESVQNVLNRRRIGEVEKGPITILMDGGAPVHGPSSQPSTEKKGMHESGQIGARRLFADDEEGW
jgi:hypothetical protein